LGGVDLCVRDNRDLETVKNSLIRGEIVPGRHLDFIVFVLDRIDVVKDIERVFVPNNSLLGPLVPGRAFNDRLSKVVR
jgi:hypothetical protein